MFGFGVSGTLVDFVTMESVEKESATHVSKDGDEISSTELDQESCLKKKKKPRRVSFAEITSVHVFDRDEDYETPPDNKPNTVEDRVRTLPGGSPRPSLKLLQDEDVDDHLQSTPTSGLQENESEQFVHEADTPGSMSDRGTPGEVQKESSLGQFPCGTLHLE